MSIKWFYLKIIIKIPRIDDEKIAKLDLPVMGFHFGDKVHRLDVTKALLQELKNYLSYFF